MMEQTIDFFRELIFRRHLNKGKMTDLSQKEFTIEQLKAELRKAQDTICELKDKVNRYQRVIDHLPHYYTFWKDLKSCFLGGDKRFYQKGGYGSMEEMIGKTDFESAWSKEAQGFYNIDQMVMNQNLPGYTVIEQQTPVDGETVWLSTTKVAMNDDNGNVIGLVGVSDDVTEKLKREKLLRESEHRFRQLSEASSEGVAIHKNGKITDTNFFLAEMFNYDAKELIGMPLVDLLVPEFQKTLLHHLETNSSQPIRAIGLKHNPLSLTDAQIRFDVEITLRNDPIQAISIHDITEQIKVEKIKDDFLANTSHELRTPLNGIIGISESLIEGVAGALPNKVKSNLLMIVTSARRLYNLVNDILDYSKMRHDSLELEKKPVNLKDITDLILSLTQPLIVDKPLQLLNEIPDSLPPVIADEDRLQQILYNLIGNAIKFTAQGEIRVTAEPQGSKIKISVSDSGIGIPNSRQMEIFKSFQQADSSTKREYGGTGLGLTISRQLVQLHGSELKVSSIPEKGSTFYFHLNQGNESDIQSTHYGTLPSFHALATIEPFIEDTGPVDNLPKTFSAQGDGQTILVVDDEAINLQMIKNFLKLHEYNVISAQSGYQALDILKTHQPDLIILDIMMPRMDGYELCGLIRRSYDAWQMPILFLTAKNQVSDLVRGLSSGANDFLTKPFFQEELLIRVKTHLSVKASFETIQENQQLKIEIHRRKQAELELDHSQKRLARILDVSDDALIAVNENQEIVYFNKQAEGIFGFQREHLLNQSIEKLLVPGFIDTYQRTINEIDRQFIENPVFKSNTDLNIVNQSGEKRSLVTAVTTFELDDERVYTFIINDQPNDPIKKTINKQNTDITGKIQLSKLVPKGVVQGLLKEQLSKSDSIRFVEGIFDNIIKYLVKGGADLIPQLQKGIEPIDKPAVIPFYQKEDFRLALTDLMTLSVNYWKSTTSKSKWQLAEESGLWKAYLDQGAYKTRTMDKYLNPDKLPRNPKWNRVLDTAEFVLSSSSGPQNEKHLLLKNSLSMLLKMVNDNMKSEYKPLEDH